MSNIPKRIFFRCVDLAQTWVLMHEIAHAIDLDFWSTHTPDFFNIRRNVLNCVDQFDIGPQTAKNWTEEMSADVLGAHLFFNGELARFSNEKPTVDYPCEFGGASVVGGIALAYEVIYQLQKKTCHKDTGSTHPPLRLRWEVFSNYVNYLAQPRPEVHLDFVAQTIGAIPCSFSKYSSAIS